MKNTTTTAAQTTAPAAPAAQTPATAAPAAIRPAAHGADYYKAERAAARAAAHEQYVHGKSALDLLRAPDFTFNAADDGGMVKTYTVRVNVFAQVADKQRAALIRALLNKVHAHVKQATVEARRADDAEKISRNAIVAAMQEIADAMELGVTIKRRDALDICDWMTAAKRNGVNTDTAVRAGVARQVQNLLTNKVNGYNARVMCGKDEIKFAAPAK